MASPPDALSPEDEALLSRLAARIAELRLEVPAILTLESSRPVSLLAGQAMIFFEPIAQSLFRLGDYRRFAALVENRGAIERFIQLIEQKAEERRAPKGGGGSSAPPSASGAPTRG